MKGERALIVGECQCMALVHAARGAVWRIDAIFQGMSYMPGTVERAFPVTMQSRMRNGRCRNV